MYTGRDTDTDWDRGHGQGQGQGHKQTGTENRTCRLGEPNSKRQGHNGQGERNKRKGKMTQKDRDTADRE
jgi:hypothetical protein